MMKIFKWGIGICIVVGTILLIAATIADLQNDGWPTTEFWYSDGSLAVFTIMSFFIAMLIFMIGDLVDTSLNGQLYEP